MDRISARIQEALDQAEAAIREVGAEAFRTGDDAGAAQAREAVAGLNALQGRLNGLASPMGPPRAKGSGGKNAPTRGGKRGNVRKANPRTGYPRYEVRNGSLVRIGWSKKQKSEYQHKVSRDIFERTVAAIEKVRHSGAGPFMAEKIIEQTDVGEGPVPSYQAYVVIGLLRDRGCIEQVGREGYMIHDDISARAMRVWEQLEEEAK